MRVLIVGFLVSGLLVGCGNTPQVEVNDVRGDVGGHSDGRRMGAPARVPHTPGASVTTTTLSPREVLAATDAAFRAASEYAAASTPTTVIRLAPATTQTVDGTGTVNGYPCGGSLPPCCVLERESKGNPEAVEPGHQGASAGDPGDPTTHASGLWQDMPSTWNNYKGYPYAAAAPPAVQNEFNALLWNNGAGASNWAGSGC